MKTTTNRWSTAGPERDKQHSRSRTGEEYTLHIAHFRSNLQVTKNLRPSALRYAEYTALLGSYALRTKNIYRVLRFE